jgi:hypothetical protein
LSSFKNPLTWSGWSVWGSCLLPIVVTVTSTAVGHGWAAVWNGLLWSIVPLCGAPGLLLVMALRRREPPRLLTRLWLWALLGGAAAASIVTLIELIVGSWLAAMPDRLGSVVVLPAAGALMLAGVLLAIATSHPYAVYPWCVNVWVAALGFGAIVNFDAEAGAVPAGAWSHAFPTAAVFSSASAAGGAILLALIIVLGGWIAPGQFLTARFVVGGGGGVVVAAESGGLVAAAISPGGLSEIDVGCMFVVYAVPIVCVASVARTRRWAAVVARVWRERLEAEPDAEIAAFAYEQTWREVFGCRGWLAVLAGGREDRQMHRWLRGAAAAVARADAVDTEIPNAVRVRLAVAVSLLDRFAGPRLRSLLWRPTPPDSRG